MSLAIITGASSGIGREFALQLKSMAGVDEFWLIARSRERMERLAEELSCKCKILSLDLATDEGIEEYRAALESEKPQVDFFVAAAGFGVFGAFDVIAEETVCKMIDLNVKAVVRMTHMTVPPESSTPIPTSSGRSCMRQLPVCGNICPCLRNRWRSCRKCVKNWGRKREVFSGYRLPEKT